MSFWLSWGMAWFLVLFSQQGELVAPGATCHHGEIVVQLAAGREPGQADVRCQRALDIVRSVLADLEGEVTRDVSKLHAAAGEHDYVPVSASTLELLRSARELGRQSSGLFDVTTGAAVRLWSPGAAVAPDERKVQNVIGSIDYRMLELDERGGRARLRRPRTRLALADLTRAFALDRAASALRRSGQTTFLLRAGDELYAASGPWRAVLGGNERTLEDAALSFVDRSHQPIIDPKTGAPADTKGSWLVQSGDCVSALALGRALFIAGPGARDALLSAFPRSAAWFFSR